MEGVTWARRQRTRSQARNGLKRVCVRTLRRVSIVRLVVRGIEGMEGWRVLFVVIIFLAVDIVDFWFRGVCSVARELMLNWVALSM